MMIVIIGILAIVAIPAMMPATRVNVREAAEMVASDLRRTQDIAMSENRSRSIVFTSGSGTYTMDAPSYFPTATESETLPTGVTFATTVTITFNSLGEPNAAATINLSGGGRTVQISVSQYTGSITIT
jgi:type II secretory pathway pseudopilin PulG